MFVFARNCVRAHVRASGSPACLGRPRHKSYVSLTLKRLDMSHDDDALFFWGGLIDTFNIDPSCCVIDLSRERKLIRQNKRKTQQLWGEDSGC